jgi:hypothetical protein
MEAQLLNALKKEHDRVARQLAGISAAIRACDGYNGGEPRRKRKPMSAKTRKMIAAAQKARWARVKAK